MSETWPSCRCPAGRPSGHPRHAGCWKPDRATPNATPPRFPDRCPEHADVAVPGNCGDCADVRKARAAPPRLSLVPANDTFQRPPWCGDCDQFTRLRETDTGMARCGACHPLAQEAS